LPAQAISGTTTVNQWKGTISITGNAANFFADYTNIDAVSCARLVTKTPVSSGVTGIAVAATAAGLSSATVNPPPVSVQAATTACTSATAVRFVMSG
jgi:PilS N terminal